MELGKLSMEQGNYQEAYTNFRHAQAIAPGENEPTFYINLIKRLEDQRVEPKPAAKVFHPPKKSRDQIIDEALQRQQLLLEKRPERKTEPARKVTMRRGAVLFRHVVALQLEDAN